MQPRSLDFDPDTPIRIGPSFETKLLFSFFAFKFRRKSTHGEAWALCSIILTRQVVFRSFRIRLREYFCRANSDWGFFISGGYGMAVL